MYLNLKNYDIKFNFKQITKKSISTRNKSTFFQPRFTTRLLHRLRNSLREVDRFINYTNNSNFIFIGDGLTRALATRVDIDDFVYIGVLSYIYNR